MGSAAELIQTWQSLGQRWRYALFSAGGHLNEAMRKTWDGVWSASNPMDASDLNCSADRSHTRESCRTPPRTTLRVEKAAASEEPGVSPTQGAQKGSSRAERHAGQMCSPPVHLSDAEDVPTHLACCCRWQLEHVTVSSITRPMLHGHVMFAFDVALIAISWPSADLASSLRLNEESEQLAPAEGCSALGEPAPHSSEVPALGRAPPRALMCGRSASTMERKASPAPA
mmetsp:Transcript_57221/g.131349  ORF Transcript_57221/g.131349 Transcript_57221/m.131349 type:complete len:228 (+) Transcript_57221:832-1515(+)